MEDKTWEITHFSTQMQFSTCVYVLDNYHKELLDIVEFSFGTYKIISCHLKPLKKKKYNFI